MSHSQWAGIAFQRKVARHLAQLGLTVLADQWYGYVDSSGQTRFCQPDIQILGNSSVAIVECKLTQRPQTFAQLDFYAKIVALADARPVTVLAEAFHNATSPVEDVQFDFSALANIDGLPGPRRLYVHWRG